MSFAVLFIVSSMSVGVLCTNTNTTVGVVTPALDSSYAPSTLKPTNARTESDLARRVAELEKTVELMSARVGEVVDHVGYCKMFIDADALNRNATVLWYSDIPQGLKDRVGDVIRKNVYVELQLEGGNSAGAELGDEVGGMEILPDDDY